MSHWIGLLLTSLSPFSLTYLVSPNPTSVLKRGSSEDGYHVLPAEDSSVTAPDDALTSILSTESSHCWLDTRLPRAHPEIRLQLLAHLKQILCIVLLITALAALVAVIIIGSVIMRRDGDGISIQYEREVYGYTLWSAEAECLSSPRSSAIVSMTTIPERLPHVHRTIKTLLMQTLCPAAILMWLPRISKGQHTTYTIPADLEAFNSSSSILSIRWTEQDLGPATKLLPTLLLLHQQGRDDQRVVIVDDDMLYSRRLLAYYECYSRLYPDAALGHWGCPASREQCWWGAELQHPVPVDILFGTASYLVRPAFLDIERLLRYDFASLVPDYPLSERHTLQSAAFYEDDVWIALNLLLASHVKLVIPVDHDRFAPTDTIFFYRGALSHGENADYSNFERMNAVLKDIMVRIEINLEATSKLRGWAATQQDLTGAELHDSCGRFGVVTTSKASRSSSMRESP